MGDEEIWKEIPGYEGIYSVSDLGRVRRDRGDRGHCKAGRILKPHDNGLGRLRVGLCKDGKMKHWLVHRLVLLAHVGPCPAGKEVAHGDGNPKNNRLENLRYASRGENLLDAHRYGGRVTSQKLTLAQVAEIRNRIAAGETDTSIAHQFGMARRTINHIRNGTLWSHRLDEVLLKDPAHAPA